MTDIRLHNSRTRKVERLEPLDTENVRMYLCGPTVYDRAHLGNARNVIMFDVLFRLLNHVASANGWDKVTYVRNFTDVDDKINARAVETGRPISDITEETIGWYHDDMDALGNLRPTHEPRATDYIADMVTMIEDLITSGHAYAAEGHVLFSVESYADYGALSGRSVDDMIAGARVEVAPYKRNPMDFVLWKPSSDDLPGWDGPVVGGKSIGRGRPGWHIECSAMSKALLGEVFDIHGGGNDLMFPHHENEIAQSCCANHTERMAQIWMHNEMLQVEGRKMSKSLGNFFTVRDLLDQGVPGEVIRFVLLSTHYRKPMDWTEKKVREANGHFAGWRSLKSRALSDRDRHFTGEGVDDGILDALRDDLNTPLAITRLFSLAGEAKKAQVSGRIDAPETVVLFESLAFLGFHELDPESIKRRRAIEGAFEVGDQIEAILAARSEARVAKDWARADALRDALVAAGVVVTDGKGVGWEAGPGFDPDKLEGLL